MKKILAQPWLFTLPLAIYGVVFLFTFDSVPFVYIFLLLATPILPVTLLNFIAMIFHVRKKGRATSAAVTGFNIGLVVVILLSAIHVILLEIFNVGPGYGYMVIGVIAAIAGIGFVVAILLWLILFSESHLMKSET